MYMYNYMICNIPIGAFIRTPFRTWNQSLVVSQQPVNYR